MRISKPARGGAVTVEFAITAAATLLILFGNIVGALGIFRYQEVASLARQAARYASVHGSGYTKVTGQPAATADSIYKQAVLPKAVLLDPAKLQVDVAWAPNNKPGSLVTVTVKYNWVAEAIFGSVTLKSSATQQMSY